MNQKELRIIWNKFNLSCRKSYSINCIENFYKEIGLPFPKELIYTEDRYREMSDGHPRVDAEDVLKDICKKFEIEPDTERINTANKMFGEGSRRQCIEEAYLGEAD